MFKAIRKMWTNTEAKTRAVLVLVLGAVLAGGLALGGWWLTSAIVVDVVLGLLWLMLTTVCIQ